MQRESEWTIEMDCGGAAKKITAGGEPACEEKPRLYTDDLGIERTSC